MKKVFFFALLISASASIVSCGNSASDPNSIAQEAHDSLTIAEDTVTQHVTNFSTAIHQMTNDVNQIPATGDEDLDFAILLKSHHRGAVDLAQGELKAGKDDILKKIAQDIVDTQKKEFTALENFVDSLKKGPLTVNLSKNYDDSGFGKVIKAYRGMMWDMSRMDTNMVADQQFAAVMIPHLQSVTYLSQGFLKYGKDPWLIQKSKEIIQVEMKQIESLKSWSNKNKQTP